MTREWDSVFVCLFVCRCCCCYCFLLGTNGSIFNLLNSPLVCERMPKTTVGFATKRLFLCSFKIDRMIVLFLFLFVCFYLIFEDKFECIALSCFSFVVVVVVVGIEGLNTGLPREFPVFVLIFFFFFASILP